MSSAKGGSGAKTYDYFGTLAGIIGAGIVSSIQAVIIDGRTVVTGPVDLTTAATVLPIDPGLDDVIDTGGRLTVYRGDQTTADADLPGHPAYVGMAYLVAVKLRSGTMRQSAPNVQVIATRKPVVSTDLVASIHNTVTTDGQCNPVASLAELLTSDRWGLGWPTTAMDASSWLAAASWAHDSSRRLYTHCSPILTSQTDAREAIALLLAMIDATLYWTPSGTLAIALLQPGVNPGGLTTLDARHIVDRPRLEAPGWDEVPTTVRVKYRDGSGSFKERSQQVSNLFAYRQRGGLRNDLSIDRPFVTSQYQAALHAAEAMRRAGQPVGEIELIVRRPFAAGLAPGSKVLVDVDAEPGGSGLAQLCVVQERSEPGAGSPIKLTLRPDTLVASTPYSPTFAPISPQEVSCPPIDEDKALVIPLPPKSYGQASVAVLATRPSPAVIGFRVFFSPDDLADFADLGRQQGFACRVKIKAGTSLAYDAEEVILTMPDGDDGADAYLATRFPGSNIGADSDDLLLIIANVDANGRVVITDDTPEMEFCSVISRALVSGNMTYTIMRSRKSTFPRDWSDTATAYLIPGESVVAWTHESMKGLLVLGGLGYLRLVAYQPGSEDESTPIPQRSFEMPAQFIETPIVVWSSPNTSIGTADGSGNFTVGFEVKDGNGDLISIKTSLVRASDGRITAFPEATFPGANTGGSMTRALTGLAADTYDFVVTAQDRAGNITQDRRQIFRAAVSGGGSLRPPVFDPPQRVPWYYVILPGGTPFNPTLTISVASPAIKFEFYGAHLGSGFLAIPLTAINATTFTFYLTGYDVRIFARSSDGSAWSPWVQSDYVFKRG